MLYRYRKLFGSAVDPKPLDDLFESNFKRFEGLFTKNRVIPIWIYISSSVALILAFGGLYFGIDQWKQRKEDAANIEILKRFVRETEQVEKFGNWLEERELKMH